MTFSVSHAFHARAVHCAQKANLAKDVRIKKFWDDLADDWLALESTQLKIDADWRALSLH
jgi:S-adenosylmethionine hydrolase